MKIYLHIEPYQVSNVLCDISDRLSYISVKLKVLEYIKAYWRGNINLSKPFICIDTDLDRVFLVNQDARKIVSFVFGFNIKTADSDLTIASNAISRIGYKNQENEITEKMVSECHSILSDLRQRDDNVYWEQDMLIGESDEKIDIRSIRLFEHILMQEAGYLRYDDAPNDERLPYHPRFHVDINYSSNANYKVGLGKQTTIEDLFYMLDKKTKCPYLQIAHSKYDTVVIKPTDSKRKHNRK